jgi:hypothetical protein
VRIFPVLFLFGPVILWARALWLKEDARPMRRLFVGFSAVLVLGLGAGLLAGRGPAAWGQFASNLEKHEGAWLTNNVGLRNVALYGGETLRNERIDWSLPDPWQPWQETMETRYEGRRPWIWAAAALLLALAAVVIWGQSGDQALIVSLLVPFALLALTCYYWVALALVALWRTRVPVVGLLILNWALFVLHYRLAREIASGLSVAVVYGAASWGLLVLFVVWLLPEVLRAVRRRGPAVSPEPPPQGTAGGAP